MGRIVLGFHGCDISTRDGFVCGEFKSNISSNPSDWLGDSLHFLEGDWSRALKVAMFPMITPTFCSHESQLQHPLLSVQS